MINLFVAQTASTEHRAAKIETLQGFNIRRWSERGLNYWAVSDLAADELADSARNSRPRCERVRPDSARMGWANGVHYGGGFGERPYHRAAK